MGPRSGSDRRGEIGGYENEKGSTLDSYLDSLKILKWLLFFILSLINFCHSILMFSHWGFMHKAVERVKRRFDPVMTVRSHSKEHDIAPSLNSVLHDLDIALSLSSVWEYVRL